MKRILKDKSLPNIERLIAKIVQKAMDYGDTYRLNFLLDRLIGKVPDRIEADILHLVDQVKYLRDLPREELLKIANNAMSEVIHLNARNSESNSD